MDSSNEWTHPTNMPYFLSGNMWLTINWTIGDLMAASSYKQRVFTTPTGSSQDDLNVSQSNDLKAVMLLLFVFILQFLLLKLLKVNLLEGFCYDNFS